MKFSTVFTYLAAAVFGFYGLAFALQPYEMALLTTGLKPDTVAGLVDLRATYGGIMIAVGALIIYLHKTVGVHLSLTVVWVVLLSMAATRLLGFVIDGLGNSLMPIYFVAEIIGVMVALALIKTEKRNQPA